MNLALRFEDVKKRDREARVKFQYPIAEANAVYFTFPYFQGL